MAKHIHIHVHATRDAGAFNEGDHPRAPDGKFGSGGSSGGAKKLPPAAKSLSDHKAAANAHKEKMRAYSAAGGHPDRGSHVQAHLWHSKAAKALEDAHKLRNSVKGGSREAINNATAAELERAAAHYAANAAKHEANIKGGAAT